ncbi:pyridoxamine 5'-phosphate oxidase family protein, partial [Methanobrevibacter sp.]
MSNIKKVDEFLTDAEVFYLATVTEENKPKNRPLGFHMLVDDKIYFGVGTFKEVYKQMKENPYVEISATVNANFIRYYGKVVFDDDPKLVDMVFE